METSAKNASNVEQAFMAMAADIKKRYENVPSFLIQFNSNVCIITNSLCVFLIL